GLDVDGYVWIFSSSHGTSRPSYIHRSTLPYSIDEFERVKTTNFSYPEVTWLQSRGFFVLFTKYVNHRRFLHCSSSVDGRRWKRPAMVAAIQKGHYQISWSDGTRVGTAFNYHPEDGGLNARTNLYYMETPDAGHTWTTAAGEPVHVPLTNVDNNTRVHDYDRERKLVYLVDMDFDARGFPVILYVTSSGFESGPRNDPRTWTTARWTGGNWVISGGFISHSNYDVGAMYLLEDRRWLIVGPTSAGPQLYNPGGEMDAWESHDQGASWQLARHLTRGSMFNHTYARKPVHAHPEFFTFWADGDTRKLSESRLFFYNCEKNKVFQLPRSMDKDEHFFT
nr:BNR-4 repeat-containing protein [Candidatus Sigynarchaeota archaeon]